MDTNTAWVVWPETALSAGVREDDIKNSPQYKPVFDFVNRHPKITLPTGVETYLTYGGNKATSTAQFNQTSKFTMMT